MKWHEGEDSWGQDSYAIPSFAVAGCSYTGETPDSPCPRKTVELELVALETYLRKQGITDFIWQATKTGNIFCSKLWLVCPIDTRKARRWTTKWLAEHKNDTRLIHDAS